VTFLIARGAQPPPSGRERFGPPPGKATGRKACSLPTALADTSKLFVYPIVSSQFRQGELSSAFQRSQSVGTRPAADATPRVRTAPLAARSVHTHAAAAIAEVPGDRGSRRPTRCPALFPTMSAPPGPGRGTWRARSRLAPGADRCPRRSPRAGAACDLRVSPEIGRSARRLPAPRTASRSRSSSGAHCGPGELGLEVAAVAETKRPMRPSRRRRGVQPIRDSLVRASRLTMTPPHDDDMCLSRMAVPRSRSGL
jgi:hypothetical protein